MSYSRGKCWADLNLETSKCPLAILTESGCPGGSECPHRGSTEARQCENPEATPVGLCAACYAKYVGESP